MFAAVLDTNVLWPGLQRDFLLSLAAAGLFRPLWSEHILDELRMTQVRKLVGQGVNTEVAQARAGMLEARMREEFPDAIVTGYEPLIGSFKLPDPEDEHVVPAAVLGGAGLISTGNTKHFPAENLPWTLEIATPTEFASMTVEIDPNSAWRALQAMATRSGRHGPKVTALEIVNELIQRYDMQEMADFLPIPATTPQESV